MTKAVPIDASHPSTKTPFAARRAGDRSHEVIAAAAAPRSRPDPVGASEALARALEIDRERLRAALCRIDVLEAEGLHLRHQAALLQRAVSQARRFAYHDELTGLPNRRLLSDRYDQAVAFAARRDRLVALIFLDLDGFKSVNDTHGHAFGDAILQQVALRLRASIRASDTACRYGGDEFVVLLTDLEGPRNAVAASEKIRARLGTPYVVDATEIAVPASIGMALYPVDGNDYGDLIRATDGSMYREKARAAARRGLCEAGNPAVTEPRPNAAATKRGRPDR